MYGTFWTRQNNQTRAMILAVDVSLNEILEMGRSFPWPRPAACGECGGSRLWGDGFVSAFFEGIDEPVPLRLYRCPDCGCVYRLKPAGYFRRFQASVETIRSSIAVRLNTGRWPPGISRARAGHWLRSLKRKTEAYLGHAWLGCCLVEAFERLIPMGTIPASRSFKAVFIPHETYPHQPCRCARDLPEIGAAPSTNEEACPCTTRSNGSQLSDTESFTTSWATSSSRPENRSDSSGRSATAHGSSRSPPRPGSPEAPSCAGSSSTRTQAVNSKLSPAELAVIREKPEPSTKRPGLLSSSYEESCPAPPSSVSYPR